MSDFDVLGTVGKLALPTFARFQISRESELGFVRYGPANRGHRGVFGPFGGTFFQSGFRLDPVKSWRSESSTSCMDVCLLSNAPGLADQLVASQEDSARKRGNVGGKIPEISAQPYFVGPVFMRVVDVAPDIGFRRSWYRRKACATYFSKRYRPCTEASLGSQDMILRTEAVGMFLMPRVLTITPSFLVRFWPVKCRIEALITFFRMVKERSVRFSFRSGQRSGQTLVKLGQPWSNLVEFGQSSPNSGKCIPDRVSRVFGHSGPQSGQKRSGQTLVKLGQPWSNLAGSARAVSFCVPTPEKIPWAWSVKGATGKSSEPTVWNLNPNTLRGDSDLGTTQAANRVEPTVWNLSPNTLRGDLTWGLPKLQIGWNQRFGISVQTAANRSGTSTVWNLSPNTLRGDLTWGLPKLQIGVEPTVWNLSPNTLRGDLTWGLPKLQIGVEPTVWNLSPNTLRGDLTWGLPKLQIGVEPTVWNLSPNTLRGDLTWGLPKLQIGWNLQRFGISVQTRVILTWGLPKLQIGVEPTVWNLSPNTLRGDLTWGLPKLQIGVVSTVWNLSPNRLRGDLTWGLPKLQIGVEPTVWNLSPNTLRGDLTWGLPKLQIGWNFNGLESQSKHVEGPNRLRGDLTWGLPKLQIGVVSTVWNLSPNRLRGDLTWELPKLQIGWFQRFGISVQTAANRVVSTVWNLSPNRLRGDLTWGLPKLQIGWFQRCLTDVVVAEIVAGPHALDSCECMNIEGAMQAPLRWLLLCLLGRSALAFHTLGLTISIPYSRASIPSPIWEILQEVSIRLDDVDLQ
uniref:Uncharacterized protein n=1 Tax=Fagus sylvatica TaxID=28930 RepID=A0A2N9JAC9_FAGSY